MLQEVGYLPDQDPVSCHLPGIVHTFLQCGGLDSALPFALQDGLPEDPHELLDWLHGPA